MRATACPCLLISRGDAPGIVDRRDVVASDCERVRVVHGSEEEVREQEDAFYGSLPRAVSEFFFGTFWEGLTPDPTESG